MPANPADTAGLFRDIANWPLMLCPVVIEKQSARPGQGVSSTYKIGYGYGVLIGVLAALKFPVVEVAPATWKRATGLTGKDKEASRALARSLWPDCELLSRKGDHGRAEALLIARYGIQKGVAQ